MAQNYRVLQKWSKKPDGFSQRSTHTDRGRGKRTGWRKQGGGKIPAFLGRGNLARMSEEEIGHMLGSSSFGSRNEEGKAGKVRGKGVHVRKRAQGDKRKKRSVPTRKKKTSYLGGEKEGLFEQNREGRGGGNRPAPWCVQKHPALREGGRPGRKKEVTGFYKKGKTIGQGKGRGGSRRPVFKHQNLHRSRRRKGGREKKNEKGDFGETLSKKPPRGRGKMCESQLNQVTKRGGGARTAAPHRKRKNE